RPLLSFISFPLFLCQGPAPELIAAQRLTITAAQMILPRLDPFGLETSYSNSSDTIDVAINYIPDVGLIVAFDILYILGFVLVTAILLTAWLSSQVQRSSLWFLFLGSWSVASFANLLLLGNQTNRNPNKALCLIQASLIYASPVLNATTCLSFMTHVYLSVRITIESASRLPTVSTRMLHVLPWVSFLAVIVEVIAVGLMDPKQLVPDASGMYCHIMNPLPNRISATLTIACMVVVIILDVLVTRILRTVWQESRTHTRPHSVLVQEHFSLDIVIRV
ncbi:hypothetical protein CVT24_013069, partial [Panaeolus cyanescens]